MTETLWIECSYDNLRVPLTLKGIEVARQFLDVMKEFLGDED